MEENQNSISKNILGDKNEKSQNLIKTKSSLLFNISGKYENIYKNKELNKFKDEILSYISERDNYYSEKIKSLNSRTDNNSKSIEQLSNIVKNNIDNILSMQTDVSTKLDKIKSYDSFMNKANDKLISHEIRINNMREDLSRSNQKYDKIYLENLEVPGYIGRASKYPNCKTFFIEIIKELDKFNKFKDKNMIDLYTYKEKLENIIKTFQTIVENNNDSQIKYITKLNDKINKNLLETMEEKIKNVRIDNSIFSKDLIERTSELNILYDKINSIKENILKEFDKYSKEYKEKIEETNKLFDEYKVEYEIIRTKFFELADFIKKGKFTTNFISTIGRKEINSISKKLNKDIKNKINPKDVKLMNNIEEIEKMDFKDKNTLDSKSNYNMNNNKRRIKFSKSQNNFNHGNNLGKYKKSMGLTKNNGNNLDKNSLDKEKKAFKLNHGSLFYYKGKNLTDVNSTKNASNKKNTNIFKNTNLDLDNIITAKNNDGNYISIKNPKSERRSLRNTDDLIKKIKKEKINNKDNKEELIELKLTRRKKEKESRNNNNNDLSISESLISNINNSINTFSTTNEKNNSFNSININNNKIGKFNLFEEANNNQNDKIIKEIASDLEQSTVKGKNFASNKKKIEENFKSICDKIQPVNLKLNNQNNLEKIDEIKEKNNNVTNKSEQNTTLFSYNINNNLENSNNNSISKNNLGRNNKKLKELIELTEKLEENSNSIKTNINNSIKNNETNYNTIDKRMSIYDKKLDDLELFTKEQILEVINQLSLLKNNYYYLSNIIIKKENNNSNPFKINDYNTINNSHSRVNIFNKSNNSIKKNNNENKNTLNLTSNYFYKKMPTIEINSKISSITKKAQINEDINLSDNLFYNGNYYFNIKDILEKKKDKNNTNISHYLDNKKLLKSIDTKALESKINNKNII